MFKNVVFARQGESLPGCVEMRLGVEIGFPTQTRSTRSVRTGKPIPTQRHAF